MVSILLRSKWMSKNSKTSSNKAIAAGTSLGIIIGAVIGSKTGEVDF